MKYLFYVISLFSFLLVSCTTETTEEEEAQGPKMSLYLNMDIPNSELMTRAWGDPGEPGLEHSLPRYIYVFVSIVKSSGSSSDLQSFFHECAPGDWVKEPLDGNGLVWRHNEEIVFSLNTVSIDSKNSKVYAIATVRPLQLNKLTTVEEVEELIFDPAKYPDMGLLDVYASSKNDPKNGEIKQVGTVLKTKVVCSHIVACLDFQWNIAPEKMQEYEMKEVKVTGLAEKCYFFEPTKVIPSETYNESVVLNGFTEGNKWYGRAVGYAFDRNKVNCTYTLNQYNLDASGVRTDLKGEVTKSKEYDPASHQQPGNVVQNAYANWYRINAKFGYNKP